MNAGPAASAPGEVRVTHARAPEKYHAPTLVADRAARRFSIGSAIGRDANYNREEVAVNFRKPKGMQKPLHLCRSFALAGLLGLSGPPSAIGCAFHSLPEVDLGNMYPGSLPVAVALRKAADSGVIDAGALEAPSRRGKAAYGNTMLRLLSFNKALAKTPAAANLPASFSLGYVESQLWVRFSQAGGAVSIDIHTNGPVDGEAVVLTGEPVLTEVLAGRLSIDSALANGTITIDGNESAKASIRNALNATSATHPRSKSTNGQFVQTTLQEK